MLFMLYLSFILYNINDKKDGDFPRPALVFFEVTILFQFRGVLFDKLFHAIRNDFASQAG